MEGLVLTQTWQLVGQKGTLLDTIRPSTKGMDLILTQPKAKKPWWDNQGFCGKEKTWNFKQGELTSCCFNISGGLWFIQNRTFKNLIWRSWIQTLLFLPSVSALSNEMKQFEKTWMAWCVQVLYGDVYWPAFMCRGGDRCEPYLIPSFRSL